MFDFRRSLLRKRRSAVIGYESYRTMCTVYVDRHHVPDERLWSAMLDQKHRELEDSLRVPPRQNASSEPVIMAIPNNYYYWPAFFASIVLHAVVCRRHL